MGWRGGEKEGIEGGDCNEKRKSRFMLNISIARSEHKYRIAVKELFVKGTWTVDEMTFPGGCYFLN